MRHSFLIALVTLLLLSSAVVTLGHVTATENLTPLGPDKFLESKGSFAPKSQQGSEPGVFNFMAPLGPVIVFSNNIKNNSKIIEFDDVPATTPPEFMRFMPPYQAIFYVFNRDTEDININSIQLTDVASNQSESPFEFCGMNYNKTSILLPPGYTQTFSVCFFPKVTGYSNATVQFYNGSQVIFDIPLRGNGVLPTGMSEETGLMTRSNNRSDVKDVNFTQEGDAPNLIGKIPFALSNLSSDSPTFLIEPLSECSVTIEGGGQRPNPAVDGYGANILSQGPPDDGFDMNDDSKYHHKINVGELVKLQANVSGVPSESVQNIRWAVDDPKIKNYDESIPGKFVTYNLTAQDYLKPAISFYWTDDGVKEVTVSVEGISNNQSKKCSTSRILTVERNNEDINRQAADFYIFNHNATVLQKHLGWHVDNAIPEDRPCDPSYNGEKFFVFHKNVISNFDAWRETFGYPRIMAWDPATDPPNSIDLVNENRNPIYKPQPTPSYYTTEGGRTFSYCDPVYNQNTTKLSDYRDADYLASEIEQSWHNDVHGYIGGDMNDLAFAPKDPVFWMWHKYIDSVYDKYTEINQQ